MHLVALPNETLESVYLLLADIDLLHLQATCRSLYRRIRSAHVWRIWCGGRLGPVVDDLDWQREYQFRNAVYDVFWMESEIWRFDMVDEEQIITVDYHGLLARVQILDETTCTKLCEVQLCDSNGFREQNCILKVDRRRNCVWVDVLHSLQQRHLDTLELIHSVHLKHPVMAIDDNYFITRERIFSLDDFGSSVLPISPFALPLALKEINDTIYLAGRFPSLLLLDRKTHRPYAAVHSGATTTTLALLNDHILAAGTFKGRGSIEVLHGATTVHSNRFTAGKSVLHDVDVGRTRIAVGGFDGTLRCYDHGLSRVVKEIDIGAEILSIRARGSMEYIVGTGSQLGIVKMGKRVVQEKPADPVGDLWRELFTRERAISALFA